MRNKISMVIMAGLFHVILVTPSYSVEVVMKEYGFTPKTVEVKVGETVTWINKGDLYHSAEQGEDCKSAENEKFSSYSLWPIAKKPGEKFEMVFDKPGTYQYYCRTHCEQEKMLGIVIVKP